MCSTIYPTLCLIIALFRGVVVCAGSDYLEQRGLQGVSHSSTQGLPNPVLKNVLAEAHKALARRGNGRTCSTSTSATTAKKSTTTAKTTSTSKSTTTSTTKSIATTTTTSAIPTPTGTSPWAVSHQYLGGSNFFTGWDFFVDSDPTNGIVDYVDQTTASASGLISAKNGVTIIGVDTTAKVTGNHNSVRIQTQATYSGGLVLMDSSHMPTGCGTWSIFPLPGLSWPYEGEIDIVEGLNNYTVNQATLHTNTGCTLPSSNPTSLGATDSLTGSTNCSAWDNYNAGCGFLDTRTTSFGPGFNSNGGGVYAMLWADTGISVYFF
ncbi:concanavalin A-like lectin/glucanase domain-containing protein, partial [Amylostereum chailletii]